LVAALFAAGRTSEASEYLAQLGNSQPDSGRTESLAIAAAIKQNDLKAALGIAQKAVDQGSNDPVHYISLASLLSVDGQKEKAELVFAEAIKRFPAHPAVWNAQVSYFVSTNQPDQARRTLEQLSEVAEIDESAKNFMLGQGYELLGDRAAAEERYRATLTKDSRNTNARLRLAKLLLSSNVVAAREQFEEVLKVEPTNGEARRFVASLLAVSGNQEDWARALQLLQSGEQAGVGAEAIANDRLRALLLSRRGRDRVERAKNLESARGILESSLNRAPDAMIDLDRLLVAGLLEQEAILKGDSNLVQTARDVLRPLVDRADPPADNLVKYIQLLLRHLEQKQLVDDDAARNAQRRAAFIEDARLRIDELQASLGEQAPADRRILPVIFRVRLMDVEGRGDEGLQLLNEFASKELQGTANDADRAKLLLQFGNLCTSIGYPKEAEAFYRQLLPLAPKSYVLLAKMLIDQKKIDDAVELCLSTAKDRPAAEVATVLAQLLPAASDGHVLDERVRSLIASALQDDGDNVNLLMSIAVRHVAENNNQKAAELFKRVVDLQPNNTLALNNLATLLAEQPDQLDEARKYVERAMVIEGRNPALLDTLGTILIRAGKFAEAVTALEEAVAGSATDPRYYFHLAAAYQRVGRSDDARKNLETSRNLGLDQAILTTGDRELLDSLNRALPGQPTEKNGQPNS
jgi:tetratricopeptide (TPR) repeat protein